MHCSLDLYNNHGKVAWGYMNLRYYAYLAYLLPILPPPGTPSRAAGPFAEESQVTAARQHTLKTGAHLPRLARTVREGEP